MLRLTIPSPIDALVSSARNIIAMYPSISDYNEFIPIHALVDGERLSNSNGRTLVYDLSIPMLSEIRGVRSVSDFCKNLFSTSYRWMKLTSITVPSGYYCYNGILIHVEELPVFKITPLLVLAVRKNDLFNISRNNLDISKFSLLIDRKLISETHNKMYRNVKRDYMDVLEKDIDFHYSNNIMKLCYNPEAIVLPKFKSVDEMTAYYKELDSVLLNSILTTDL